MRRLIKWFWFIQVENLHLEMFSMLIEPEREKISEDVLLKILSTMAL